MTMSTEPSASPLQDLLLLGRRAEAAQRVDWPGKAAKRSLKV
jgi:hypothetical protein